MTPTFASVSKQEGRNEKHAQESKCIRSSSAVTCPQNKMVYHPKGRHGLFCSIVIGIFAKQVQIQHCTPCRDTDNGTKQRTVKESRLRTQRLRVPYFVNTAYSKCSGISISERSRSRGFTSEEKNRQMKRLSCTGAWQDMLWE